jgi:hypothetical protein
MGVTGTPAGRRGETARAFVGRAAGIQSVVAAADDTVQGHPQLVVIVGPCRDWEVGLGRLGPGSLAAISPDRDSGR